MIIKNNLNQVFDKIITKKNNKEFLSQKNNDYNNNTNYFWNNSNFTSSNNQSPFKVSEKPIFQTPNNDNNNNLYEAYEKYFLILCQCKRFK